MGSGIYYVIGFIPIHSASSEEHVADIQSPSAPNSSCIRFYDNSVQIQIRIEVVKNPRSNSCRVIENPGCGTDYTTMVENAASILTSGISVYDNIE